MASRVYNPIRTMVERLGVPGVVFRPLRHAKTTWDLLIAWPRGKITDPVRALVDALSTKLSTRSIVEVNVDAKAPAAGKISRRFRMTIFP